MSQVICSHDELKWGRKIEVFGGKEITVCGRCREEMPAVYTKPKIVTSESVPKETIFLIPSVSRVRYENLMTGEVKEVLEWNPKAAGIITNVKP